MAQFRLLLIISTLIGVGVAGILVRSVLARIVCWVLAVPPFALGCFALWQGGIAERFPPELMLRFCIFVFWPVLGCVIGQLPIWSKRHETKPGMARLGALSWGQWAIGHVLGPLVLAAIALAMLWGKAETRLEGVPFGFTMLLGAFLLWREPPHCPQACADKRLNALRRNWYALTLLALLVLILFGIYVTVAAQRAPDRLPSGPLLGFCGGLYLLHVVLAALAHACLRRLVARLAESQDK